MILVDVPYRRLLQYSSREGMKAWTSVSVAEEERERGAMFLR